MRTGLPTHRKFLRLMRTLEPHCPTGAKAVAMGSLELIWDASYQSGDDFIGDTMDVEARADWRGHAGVLTAALLDAGFIDQEEKDDTTVYRIHDLWDHAPSYVCQKAQREAHRKEQGQTISDIRRAAAIARWEKAKQAKASVMQPDASAMQVQCNRMQTTGLGKGGEGKDKEAEPEKRAPRKRHVDPAFSVKTAMEVLSGGKRVIMPRGLNAKQAGQMVTVINAAKTPEALKRVFDWLEGGAQGFREFIDLDALCSKIGTWLVASEQGGTGPVSDPRRGICEDAA